jgi:O-antigen/teichoic acid export membrane protein
MLQFSIPTVFSGLSWWVISSSDRYFVTWLCGTAVNGIYSVAYKIPTMLQAVQNVFSQAWVFTLYDSYKTEEGRRYIAKVYDFYSFVFCAGCSFLIVIDLPLSKLLYSNDFFAAWRYVPPLLLSVVFTGLGSFMGTFLSVYKKTKISMKLSFLSATINIVLNYILIIVMKDAMGAAVATAVTFFVSWLCNTIIGIKLSNVKINLGKQGIIFAILILQCFVILESKNMVIAGGLLLVILALNFENIMWAKQKGKLLMIKMIEKNKIFR